MRPPEQSGNFKVVNLPEPQTVACRCFGVVDLGVVDNTFPGNEPTRAKKIIIMWEMPELLTVFNEEKGEEPFIITQEYKYSTHKESNMSKLIAAWRNKPLTEAEKTTFDPSVMIGKIGLMSFQHKRKKAFAGTDIASVTNENTRMDMTGIGPLPKAMKEGMKPQMNETIAWDWDDIEDGKEIFNNEKFSKIYKWIRAKIYTSDNFKACPSAVNIDDNSQQASAPVPQASSQPPQAEEKVGDDWE